MYAGSLNPLAGQQSKSFAAIHLSTQCLPPVGVVQIPLHCPFQTTCKILLGPPTEFHLGLGRVDRVSTIMAWPVCNKSQKTLMRCVVRAMLIHKRTDPLDYGQVRLLIATADIVFVANTPTLQ